MTPDRLRGWLKRPAAGAERLQLCWDGPGGLQVLGDWTRAEMEQMDADPRDDLVDAIMTQAQEHTDAQECRCKFPMRWMGSNDRPLKSANHHCKPTPVEDEDPLGAAVATVAHEQGLPAGGGAPFYEAMVKELARALLDKDKALNEAYRTSLDANQKTIEMLQAQAERSFKEVAELRGMVADLQHPDVAPENREESMQRARAWEKLVDMMPEAGELLIGAAAHRLLGTEGGAAEGGAKAEGDGTNGHANNGHARV